MGVLQSVLFGRRVEFRRYGSSHQSGGYSSVQQNNVLTALVEHVVYSLMIFISFALDGHPCIASADFRAVEELCRSSILVLFSQGIINFDKDVGAFEIVRGCFFKVLYSYPTFR